ncbi:uncharacterized protein [Leptinotarsa decemlineata]|uniref:uncharacterized protein n=1 Tax=Leptinotarsa decemlineata TaxID=7539 RepID=UPI003D30BD5E
MEEVFDSLMARDRGEVITFMGLLLDRLGLSLSELLRGSLVAAVREPSGPLPGAKELLERPSRNISCRDTPVGTTLSAQSEKNNDDNTIKPQEPANKKCRLPEEFPPLPSEPVAPVHKNTGNKPKKMSKLRDEAKNNTAKSELSTTESSVEGDNEMLVDDNRSEIWISTIQGSPKQPSQNLNQVETPNDQGTSSPLPPRPEVPQSTRKTRSPPIVVRQKNKWVQFTKLAAFHKVNFTKVNIADGIKVQPSSVEDYRSMSKLLVRKKIPHHTYTLPEDRQIRAVFRGVPEHLETADIEDALVEKGFQPSSVTRMMRENPPLPLVLVQVNQNQKHIYDIRDLLNVKVKVEPQHQKTLVGQCHRCQRFGHSQRNCQQTPSK